ncbi:putative amidohydrolase [Arcticibacter tournemirensis]|uniref:Omega-amidase YafV n=1 Tax=Arcticibacter tournemirensis TaxID=699437 RepID=A0A5M9HAG7_9SPHI|nr:amidohydrolase [Arcticibacter tournemirensis]KAA8483650.1 amidohydrolase [Arcticibacter tournemirensis]TQM51394.1 putative amidohydrolase [Arcticibacter tournemirensis]
MSILKVTTFQAYLFWENIEKNLNNLALRLSSIREKTDLIILPEMFNTGFTMNASSLAEEMGGKSMQWMRQQANRFECVVTGSLAIKEEGKYYNRLIWMRPDGTYEKYDKRHLFRPGKEDLVYTAGKEKLITELNGWKICPVICYDLRFPVWLRNEESGYDLMLIVANWPERRAQHWRTLIAARAIENQAFIIGVNRVGHDGNEIYHSGDSMCIDPNGKTVYYKPNDEDLYTFSISKEEVSKTRNALPFLKDADPFDLL